MLAPYFSKRVVVVLAFPAILLFLLFQSRHGLPSYKALRTQQDLANATLGVSSHSLMCIVVLHSDISQFGSIIAISSEDQTNPTAWRQKGIVKAANRTGLMINIANQPKPDPKDIQELQKTAGKLAPNDGPAAAWLGHLNTLKK